MIYIKDFGQEQRDRHAGTDPSTLQFKLGGVVLRRLVSFSPYVLTDFQALEGPGMEDTIEYIKRMVDPESHADLERALREGDPRPSMDTLMELTTWLIQEASSRPTSPALSSTAGQNGTGTRSTGDSSPLAATT